MKYTFKFKIGGRFYTVMKCDRVISSVIAELASCYGCVDYCVVCYGNKHLFPLYPSRNYELTYDDIAIIDKIDG